MSIFRSQKTGFTLIELLVVAALISLLTALSLDFLGRSRQKGNDTRRLSDLNQIQKALELYHTDKGGYPNSLDSLISGGNLSSMPKDPKTKANYLYVAVGTGPCLKYHLGAKLEEAGSKYLQTDADLDMNTDTCGGSSDFDGVTCDFANHPPAAVDQCYDVTLK